MTIDLTQIGLGLGALAGASVAAVNYWKLRDKYVSRRDARLVMMIDGRVELKLEPIVQDLQVIKTMLRNGGQT